LARVGYRSRGVFEPGAAHEIRSANAEPASETPSEIHRVHAGRPGDVAHAEARPPAFLEVRGRVPQPARCGAGWRGRVRTTRGQACQQLHDIVVIGGEAALASATTRDDPQERSC
jgi:hypothetical protein